MTTSTIKKPGRPKRIRGLYYREGRGWYGDFRTYAAQGGGKEALIPRNAKHPTRDQHVAMALHKARLDQLRQARKDGALVPARGAAPGRTLAEYADYHLTQKARAGKVGAQWVAASTMMLKRAVTHFGAVRRLDTIDVPAVQAWVNALADGKLTAGRRLSPGSQRHHLNALSSLYRRALAEEVAVRNPATALLDKPSGADRDEADWLEVPDAALLLEAARALPPNTNGGPRSTFPYAYPLVATFLLTGGRQREVLGLELDDVSFDAGTVTFRPNHWRRLKTPGSHRTVPLWPQLREILQPYVGQRVIDRGGTLLFPATGPDGAEQMITDFRKLLDAAAKRAGWQAGDIRSKRFRHTYISARIQTTDGGAPVSVFTVAREVGHSSTAMIEKVYGHLGARRHRSPVVEYRAEQHASILGDRLTALARPRGGKTVPATVPEPTKAPEGAVGKVAEAGAGQQVAASRGL